MNSASCDVTVRNNRVKWYGILLGLFLLAYQHGCYLLGHVMADVFAIAPYLPKIPFDDVIPLIPIFVIPYAWSYAFWAMAPMAASKCESRHYKNFIAAYLFACIAGMIVLTVAPTYMDRGAENLIDRNDDSIFYAILNFWYSVDATIVDGHNMAYNLLPSFHCLNSTLAYLGVARRKEIPIGFRIYSFVMMLLIFASTVFVKQHYFLDVITGAGISVIVFFLCKKFDAGRIFDRPLAYLHRKFGKKRPEPAEESAEESAEKSVEESVK